MRIGIDKRISPYFFGYGTPYGGTCFPRDTSAFIKFAKDRKKKAKHLLFAEEVNEMVYNSILDKLQGYGRVGILGVSFKPNSPVVIGSPSARLIKDLIALGVLTIHSVRTHHQLGDGATKALQRVKLEALRDSLLLF